jgi:hypothetical protein
MSDVLELASRLLVEGATPGRGRELALGRSAVLGFQLKALQAPALATPKQ